jgi:MFS family permease
VLALFAASLGAGPEALGFAVAISTITGIFFKMPAGVLADVLGKTRTLFIGLACFALIPFAYLAVSTYQALVVVRFFHGFATAIYGPVSMAVIVGMAGGAGRKCSPGSRPSPSSAIWWAPLWEAFC